jgi:hypothetical protein
MDASDDLDLEAESPDDADCGPVPERSVAERPLANGPKVSYSVAGSVWIS